MITPKIKVSSVRCFDYSPDYVQSAVEEAIVLAGGLPEKVLKASSVLLKPNLLTARDPDGFTTTHPEVIRAFIKLLKKTGCKKIYIGDSPAGNYSFDELWTKTGMKAVAGEEGALLLPFENIRRVELSDGSILPVLREFFEMDAVISLPKLKTHALTKITGAVKNSYGLVVGNAKSAFHGKYPSPVKMARFLSEIYGMLRADFYLMDAVVAMAGDGPSNGSPHRASAIFASSDAVALDSVAASIYGYSPEDIPLLGFASKAGLGTSDLQIIEILERDLKIEDIPKGARSKADILHRVPDLLFGWISPLLSSHPEINQEFCVKCGKCLEACSQKAISKKKDGSLEVKRKKCILCMCCIESCPVHAVKLQSFYLKSFGRIRNFFKNKRGK
ncbi:MAG TPA: DUF362 domain-containing protein [Victivallales bacterium]|nr:DUF362 domain-containing protein [Victivallales bacterium]